MSTPMEHPIVSEAVRGHPGALSFLRAMAKVMHWFDDLVDRDKPVSDADTHTALWLALVDLPRNAFYREHFDTLNPIVVMAITNWRIANVMERGKGTADLRISFIIRSSYIDLVAMCAALIVGHEWSVQHGVELRRWAHSETFTEYLNSLAVEGA